MKRKLSLLIALLMLFALTARAATPNEDQTPGGENSTPSPTPDSGSGGAGDAVPSVPDTFLWDDFDLDPQSPAELSANGVNRWWWNDGNTRQAVDNGVLQIQYRPKAFDPEDFDDLDDYYSRAMDWMGNWGEAINMWAIDGVAFSRYLTIRMAGEAGGEENKLLLHFQPEDGPVFIKRFSDLVTKDGGSPAITTDMQDIVIDLEASGFPGMTNRMHIRAFAECTVYLDEIVFSTPVRPLTDDVMSGITLPEMPIDSLPIADYVAEA